MARGRGQKHLLPVNSVVSTGAPRDAKAMLAVSSEVNAVGE